jgi:hypothetical protein
MRKEREMMRTLLPAVFLLAFASITPAQAESCPLEARLRADPRWAPLDNGFIPERDSNTVFVGPGAELRWNGGDATEAVLATYLGLVAKMSPRPVTLLGIQKGADCALLSRVVAAIEAHAPADCEVDCRFELAVPGPPPPETQL